MKQDSIIVQEPQQIEEKQVDEGDKIEDNYL